MRAVTVVPLKDGSVDLTELPEPPESDGPVLVKTRAVGVCGTDLEIIGGQYGWAPPGEERLAIGHESLGEVIEAPSGADLGAGDLVVAIVRRPDPVPCSNCAAGEWDMCRNGQYTEWGIKEHHGYARERYRVTPDFVVKVDASLGNLGVLLEPTTVVAKAWEQIEAIGKRTYWEPSVALVVGAGPIGLLAALLGVQRGFDVHVLDRVTAGPKPALVRELGASYHTGSIAELPFYPHIVVECTGVAELALASLIKTAPGAVVCLTGVGGPIAVIPERWEHSLATQIVLNNLVVFGSVNANRRHYDSAADALAAADRPWLEQLITRRAAPDQFAEALARRADDIKAVVEFRRT